MQRYTIRLASYGNFFAPREPEPSEHLRDPHTTALVLALVVVRVERTLGTHSIAATFDALALVAGSQTGTGDVGMACESGVVVVSLCAANDNRPHSFVFARSFNAECVLIQFDAFPTCTWMSVVVLLDGYCSRCLAAIVLWAWSRCTTGTYATRFRGYFQVRRECVVRARPGVL